MNFITLSLGGTILVSALAERNPVMEKFTNKGFLFGPVFYLHEADSLVVPLAPILKATMNLFRWFG